MSLGLSEAKLSFLPVESLWMLSPMFPVYLDMALSAGSLVRFEPRESTMLLGEDGKKGT